jgi:uncharacterized protein YndB with AHSA1/START domain
MNAQDERIVGKTRDAGWQIGVRRTLPVDYKAAWKLITSPEGIALWLGTNASLDLSVSSAYTLDDGAAGEVRVFKPNSHLRLTWRPPSWPRPSTIQVRVIPKDEGTVVAFHQEGLPGPEEREMRRAHFTAALDALEVKFEDSNH